MGDESALAILVRLGRFIKTNDLNMQRISLSLFAAVTPFIDIFPLIYTVLILLFGLLLLKRLLALPPAKWDWRRAYLYATLAFLCLINLQALRGQSTGSALTYLSTGILVYALAVLTPASEGDLRPITLGLLIGGIISAPMGIRQCLVLGETARGSMMNSNTYGGYLVTVFPIGIGWLFAARRRWERALAIAALLAIGTALVLTFCRGSLYAMAVAVLLLAWWLRAVWLPPAAFLHYLFCMGIAPQGLAHYKAAFAMGETVRQRLALWTAAWRMAKKSPLVGVGVGNYIRLAPAQGVASYEKLKGLSGHNSYLEILAEQGLVGLAAFGILLVLNFLPALRRLFRSKGMADPWLAALTAGALAFAQQNLTNSQFLHKPNSAVAWLLMGLMVSRLHGLPPMVSPPRRRSLTTSATPRRPAL